MYLKIFPLLFTLTLFSCNKENLNNGFDNHQNNLIVLKADTFTIETFQLTADTFISSNRNENFLGTYHSEEAGVLSSNLYFSLTPVTSSFVSGTETTFDSLIIEFKIKERYGNKTLDFELYTTTSSVLNNQAYSNFDSLILGEKITDFTVNQDSTIRIKVPSVIGENWYANKDDLYTNSTNFLNQNPGFAIIPKKNQSMNNDGSMYIIEVSSIRSSLHYSNLNNNYIALATISNPSWSFYQTNYNYSGSIIDNNLNNPNPISENVIIQGLGSSKAKINLPYLIDWFENSHKIINRAELITTIVENSQVNYTPTNSLSIYKEFSESNTGFEAILNENTYNFNATTIIRDYLTNKDFNIILGTLNPHARAGLTNLNTINTSPIKLIVYYTEF